jgi:hypothetical protein
MAFYQKDIKHGDRVTILIPCGIGRNGQEYKPATGRAVMHSATGGWVLNMGGQHGTPGLADENNTLAVKRARRKSAMDIAADACGLVKVRGALGGTYYE